MSHIRGRDTKPELVVRRWLWRQGYRYRLYVRSLPGRPDIVMRKWRTVILVNGCFWHGHECNKRRPTTHAEFWRDKIARNHERDARNQALLQAAGWHVIVIWECQLTPKNRAETLRELDLTLSRIVLEANGAAPSRYNMPDENQEQALIAADAAASYHITSSRK
jgi:DNA mismatch endonuclease (patch repair protein)